MNKAVSEMISFLENMTQEQKDEHSNRVLERLQQHKIQTDKKCKSGDHQHHLRHAGFGGDKIYWRCNNCGITVTTDDSPMTM